MRRLLGKQCLWGSHIKQGDERSRNNNQWTWGHLLTRDGLSQRAQWVSREKSKGEPRWGMCRAAEVGGGAGDTRRSGSLVLRGSRGANRVPA